MDYMAIHPRDLEILNPLELSCIAMHAQKMSSKDNLPLRQCYDRLFKYHIDKKVIRKKTDGEGDLQFIKNAPDPDTRMIVPSPDTIN